MVRKYKTRLATTEDSDEPYFYFADTVEELPVYVCIALAANSDDEFDTTGMAATGDAAIVMSRASDYVNASGSDITVYANHEVTDAADYVNHLAMDDTTLVQLSIKLFCPEMAGAWKTLQPQVREAAAHEAEEDAESALAEYNRAHPAKQFTDGRYTVGKKAGMILPGTYRVKGPVFDCYWERSGKNGSTIANDFITNAPNGVKVTVRAGEGFTSQGCTDPEGGTWRRAS
ncbi:hypothetical protein [Micromonospora schwarzwaldensis]